MRRFENALRLHCRSCCLPYVDTRLDCSLPRPSDSALFSSEHFGNNQGPVRTGMAGNWASQPTDCDMFGYKRRPFHGAIAVPSVTRCRCCRRRRRCCCGHRCAGGVRQWRRATVATPGEWQCGVQRLAVANGPNIFQMLLVLEFATVGFIIRPFAFERG